MEKKKVKFRRISTVSLVHHTTKVNKGVDTSVSKFCGIFFRIFRDFAEIFDKSKLLGVRLHTPCTPGLEIKYRDTITAIHGIKYRYPTNSLKISVHYSC